MFTSQRAVDVHGVSTNVAEAGAGPDVLLLHGNPDTHAVWAPLAERLAPHARCIAPDLPGFGGTPITDDFGFSLDNQAAWVAGVADALGLAKLHLVVHDVGGPYGLAFACKHADRLRSLTIFNTNFFPDYKWHFWARVWRTRGLGEIAMSIANRPLFIREMRRGSPNMPREYANHAYDAFTKSTKRQVLRWYRAMDADVHAGWDKQLVATPTPKQVLWGDRDPFIPATTADRFGTKAVQHFADYGHWVMLEAPDIAAAAIADFVARNSR